MAKDPYGQGSPYSNWRSGGWGDLMYRQDPSDIIVGKDDMGEYTRAQQISSNFAGAMSFLDETDIANKVKGGANTYNLTAGDIDKYAENILRSGKEYYDSDDSAELRLGYLNELEGDLAYTPGSEASKEQNEAAYQSYLKNNPLLAAAGNDNLLYDENLGLQIQDKSGDMVPLTYRKGSKAFDPSAKGDAGLNEHLLGTLGYESYDQSVPQLDEHGQVKYDKDEKAQYEKKSLWRRKDDWSPEFEYEYLNKEGEPKDWTLKNLADKDWREDKLDALKEGGEGLLQKIGALPGQLKDKVENSVIKATSNQYDDPAEVYNRMAGTLNDDPKYKNLSQTEIGDMLGIEFDNVAGGIGNFRYKKGASLQDTKDLEKELISGGEKRKLTSRAQDYIDKGWAPDNTIDKDIYQELGGTHEPKGGKWLGDDKGFGANFGTEFKDKLEEKAAEFGGNMKKAWESLKDDFKSAKADLSKVPGILKQDIQQAKYGNASSQTTSVTDEEQAEADRFNQDYGTETSSEETWADEQERLNQVTLAGLEDMPEDYAGDTLEADPGEWDKRRGLGDNLLKLVKGDFASDDNTQVEGGIRQGITEPVYDDVDNRLYREDEIREARDAAGDNTGNITKDEQRENWNETFENLGEGWQDFKDEFGEGVDQLGDQYDSWKSKRAVRDIDDDSDGIPDFIDSDTQALEQGPREGTFLEKTEAKLENAKEGLLQKYGGGKYKDARDDAKLDKFYEDNPTRNRQYDNDVKAELSSHGGKKILVRKMELDPKYRDYIKENHPKAYKLYEKKHGNKEEASQNNLMQAWENENLEDEQEWEGGSSGSNYYDEENFNFNPGGL